MAPDRRARLRAWSNSFFGRDPSPHQDKKASALHHLASAGLDLVITPTEEEVWAEQARNAASTVLQELEKVCSVDPLQPGQLPRRITIEVVDDAQSENGVHPITGVDDNPFDPHAQTEDDESYYDFEEDIYIVKNEEGKIFSRAMIDTGMDGNAISVEKARLTNIPIEPWTGGQLRDADGEPFKPEGLLKAQFHFSGKMQTSRSWLVEFMVLHNPPFDVAIGRQFINSARLFKKSDVLLPIVVDKAKDAKAQQISNQNAKRESDRQKEEEKRRKEQIRRREREKAGKK
ncbi:hypothetical protein Z517_06011 [Fonsecaea pedrosoi CBS 271.37]|uniref:Unplaced genomic scaffold supercont1.4, whole genome shotgun sequence n=1 Tax=Fonsecaea pedrosoi CBS 271.37 TaxID=1442368 RepID=A0A0D2H427_9EURO|nr:uncharacterized protein Z517_06011 [Fonsecaea pedrosoi CBS 271.37]KIW79399.1 hypothetical protein Z517_06011 [Fonsecaea pedrosoi CBS 271.37]